jgi:RNA polymerase sigma factor (sigma-70 family)
MKDTMDDHELLEAYAKRHEEAAFRELVARYIDMVYATARRVTGNGELARDVAQAVFVDLARKPQRVREPRALGGWLYLAARYAASQATRTEQRRQQREREAMRQDTGEDGSGRAWAAAGPALDEALGTLKPAEASVIVRRFFEGKSLRETGAALQISEDAAQKRVTRALEKLRRHFLRRGAVTTAAVLAQALEAQAMQAAPAGLAESVASGALAAGAGGAGLGTILAMSIKSKILIGAAVLAGLLTVVYQQRELTALRAQLAAAQDGAKGGGTKGRNGTNAATTPSQSEGELLARVKQILAMKPGAREGAWNDFADRLNPADFLKVAKILLAQPLTHSQLEVCAMRLLEDWGKVAPAQALAFIGNSPALGQMDRNVFKGWLRSDPEAAIAWWQQQPAGYHHNGEGYDIVGQLMQSDPEAALHLLLGMKVDTQSREFIDLFSTWGGNDPAGAVAALGELPAGPLRNSAIEQLASGWSGEDPRAELAWAQTLPPGREREIVEGLGIGELSQSNLAEAIADINNLPSGERDGAILNMLDGVVDAGPDAVWTAAQQVTDASNRDSVMETSILVRESWYKPEETLKWLENVPPDAGNTTHWMQKFALYWALDAPGAAMAAAANVPEGPQRDNYVEGLMLGVTHSAPEQAEQLVASLPADQQAEAANKVAAAVAEQNPAAAAQWVATLPDGTVTAKTVDTLMDQWADNDPAAAGQWVQSLPAGTMQDGAAAAYVNDAANNYPAAAAQLAAGIGDAEKRAGAETTAAEAWLKKDPKAAEAWLAKTDLPDATKQELLAKAGGK